MFYLKKKINKKKWFFFVLNNDCFSLSKKFHHLSNWRTAVSPPLLASVKFMLTERRFFAIQSENFEVRDFPKRGYKMYCNTLIPLKTFALRYCTWHSWNTTNCTDSQHCKGSGFFFFFFVLCVSVTLAKPDATLHFTAEAAEEEVAPGLDKAEQSGSGARHRAPIFT